MKNKTAKTKTTLLAKAIRICIALVLFILLIPVIANTIVIGTAAGSIISAEDTAEIDADCILVLGAGVLNNETPSAMLADRLEKSIEVYMQGASEKILVSGDHGNAEYNEVKVMKKYAVERGIESENVFMDHAGFSTYDSLYRAKEIFGVKKVIIVTQKYHLYRAIYIAEQLGLEAYGVASDYRAYMGQIYRELREIMARTKDFAYSLIKPEPKFLGDKISLDGSGDET